MFKPEQVSPGTSTPGGKITHGGSIPNVKGPKRGASPNPVKKMSGSVKGSMGGAQGCGGQRKGYGERGQGRNMEGGKEGGRTGNVARTPKP